MTDASFVGAAERSPLRSGLKIFHHRVVGYTELSFEAMALLGDD
jgi:hypothetical protein